MALSKHVPVLPVEGRMPACSQRWPKAIEVLRRPVESALAALVAVMDHARAGVALVDGHRQGTGGASASNARAVAVIAVRGRRGNMFAK